MVAVVAVMSVQPTSENFTVLQLSGSAARAGPLPTAAIASNTSPHVDSFIGASFRPVVGGPPTASVATVADRGRLVQDHRIGE